MKIPIKNIFALLGYEKAIPYFKEWLHVSYIRALINSFAQKWAWPFVSLG